MLIAAKEIDKGYKYDINDPKAYEYWKSDIKATARGYKTVPSKYKKKFSQMYGPLPKGGGSSPLAKPQVSRSQSCRRSTIRVLQRGEEDTDPVFNNTNGLQEEFTPL